MVEAGELKQEAFKWLKQRQPAKGRSPFMEDATPLDFRNLLFPGLVLMGGGLVSIAVAIFERLVRRDSQKANTIIGKVNAKSGLGMYY